MGFLGVLGLGDIDARGGGHEVSAVQLRSLLTGSLGRLVRQGNRVGSHVGDVTVLVEALGHLHGGAG